MGWLRKKAKQIGKAIKKVGKKLKKGFGKVAKAFGKLGPIGTIAMSFILPGLGSAMSGWLGNFGSSVMKMLPEGMSTFIGQVGNTIRSAASGISDGIKNVFGKITDGIEYGMNKLGSPFGKGDVGSNFRNFLNDLSGGRIGEAEFGTKPAIDAPTVSTTPKAPKVDTTGEGLTVDEKLAKMDLKPKKGEESLLDLAKREDLTASEKIKLSKEAKTFSRVSALSKFGQDIEGQEQTIKLSQERQDQARRDYFTDFGQNSLKYMGVDTLSAQPVSFFDTNSFNTSSDPAGNYMKQVYNFEVPAGQDPMKLAMATNTYGYNFMDAVGLSE
jgi:hypothetical protein